VQGGGRVRVSGVSRGRWRRKKDRGFVGSCPSRRRAVAAPSLFPCAGLGRAGARVRVSGGEQREMEKGAGVGVSGLWEILTNKAPLSHFFYSIFLLFIIIFGHNF